MGIDPRIYPRSYRLTAPARWSLWVLGAGIVAASVAFVASPGLWPYHLPVVSDRVAEWVFLALGSASGIYLIVNGFRSRIVLTADSIEVIGPLSNAGTLRRSEILAVRSFWHRDTWPTLELVPRFGGGETVRVSGYFDRDDAFQAWMSDFADLDVTDARASQEAIASDPALGATPDARLASLRNLRKWVVIAALVCVVATMALLLLPTPLWLAAVLPATLPWLGVLIVRHWGGLFRLHDSKNDARVNLGPILFAPGIALWSLSLASLHLMDWRMGVVPAALVSGALVAAAVVVERKPRANVAFVALLFAASLPYGYGVITVCDRVFDSTTPQIFRPRVQRAHESRGGRRRTFYVDLAPWGPRTTSQVEIVSRAVYDAAVRGEPVCVQLSAGALAMPWYRVIRCD